MQTTVFSTPILTPALRGVAAILLRAGGWRIRGMRPPLEKCVVVFAPHSSNWDLPIASCAALVLRIESAWLGKDVLFRRPFGWLFRWLGGIPVDRSQHHGLVEASVSVFNRSQRLWLAVTPEGTRKKVDRWKTGFWHIAKQADIPMLLCFIDYTRREVGILGAVRPGPDCHADIAMLQQQYARFSRYEPRQLPGG